MNGDEVVEASLVRRGGGGEGEGRTYQADALKVA